MRIITSDELPRDFNKQILIKSNERNRHRSMATALEKTLNRCSEIYSEYELHTVELRENCAKEGFTTGFKLFFSQLTAMLDNYERLQEARIQSFRDNLHNALKSSLQDTVIVERIIHHLQGECGHQKPLKIIIPKSVQLQDNTDTSNYLFCEDNHITVQNDVDSIRFPSDSLCQQWLSAAEDQIVSSNKEIESLIPDLLSDIIIQLTELSEKKVSI
ncbi:type III secretion protein [Erwinia amylovora]|uniref:type III secretion protein n=1 Tax=Erwinia amylovora TaxID=552 RepID=UPI0014439F37|nr:type III secretion protein [Erwinia amylovora]